ncbi:hypothetical protein BQ8482_220012 [Mesorhizobium delmotii]|uniref:Uncharacterized protein n=1 Tax=Mesorhizobium delmotii TaxID=1631247 RepID=A0A2P9AL17_9HYPH|nr:hypothetical protein BQ8482_220012 [Mesorhizobium delmotii]
MYGCFAAASPLAFLDQSDATASQAVVKAQSDGESNSVSRSCMRRQLTYDNAAAADL